MNKLGILAFEEQSGIVDVLANSDDLDSNNKDYIMDSNLEYMEESYKNSAIIADGIRLNTHSAAAMEAIADFVKKSNDSNLINATGLKIANVAIESFCQNSCIRTGKLSFSIEDYAASPDKSVEIAVEDIKKQSAQMWTAVKSNFSGLSKAVAEKLNFFKRNYNNLKKKITELEKLYSLIDSKAEAKFPIIKPESWCSNLIYLNSGFPTGLKGIGPAVTQLLDEHHKTIKSNVTNSTNWLHSNYAKAYSDETVFRSFKIKVNDYKIGDAKEFNRSVEGLFPTNDNMFFRSKELPGGMALYTQIRLHDCDGINAIDTLSDVDYILSKYDPISFNRRKYELAMQIAAKTKEWFGMLHTATILQPDRHLKEILAKLAIGTVVAGTGAAIYTEMNAKVESGQSVKIKDDMIFYTLTKEEIKRVILELNQGLASLQNWYSVVVNFVWKSDKLDDIINDLFSYQSSKVYNGVGPRYSKKMCSAIMSYMRTGSNGVDAYSFRVYNAMANFATASAKQYI